MSLPPPTESGAEQDDELEELERFSPELLKEEPKPDTIDIPDVKIVSSVNGDEEGHEP